jgi:hypothetical protein
LIPQFTAEAGLNRGLGRHAGSRNAPASAGSGFMPQQNVILGPDGMPSPDTGASELFGTGTTITCPGCRQHACGFLGLSTCLTCC